MLRVARKLQQLLIELKSFRGGASCLRWCLERDINSATFVARCYFWCPCARRPDGSALADVYKTSNIFIVKPVEHNH